MLKTNTAKRRVHSLFRQGCMLYDPIPTMPETRLRPLMRRFFLMLQEQPLFADVFGAVWKMRGVVRGSRALDLWQLYPSRLLDGWEFDCSR